MGKMVVTLRQNARFPPIADFVIFRRIRAQPYETDQERAT